MNLSLLLPWLWLSLCVVSADNHVDEVTQILALEELQGAFAGVGSANGNL
jgi:hypothetical protein